MLFAVYIGLACAVHVRGRSRRSIRRLRRATFWCLLVFTRNALRVTQFLVCRPVKLCYVVRAFRAFRLHAEPQTRLYWA